MTMYLRQRWRDPRLANNNISSEGGVLISSKISETWLPDLYLANDKESKKSDITVLNAFLRVNKYGDLLYSQRVTATVDCSMNLERYPFDIQTCSLQMGSCEYSISGLSCHGLCLLRKFSLKESSLRQ